MELLKREKAVELRKLGKSYKEIKDIVGVSKSTLSVWLRDVKLNKEQIRNLRKRQATAYLSAEKRKQKFRDIHDRIRLEAEQEAMNRIDNSFFIAGLMLYWAEGSKNIGSVQFSNSDPGMIKLMLHWFRRFCKIPEEKFRASLFIHSLHTRKDCLDFWRDITSIPRNQFYKPYIKPTILSNRKNMLYQGTCRIVIHDRHLLSKIIGWKNGAEKMLIMKGA